MPQMAPTWWTILYFMFIMSLMIMYLMLYFHSFNLPMIQSNKIYKSKINWKW
uniref:ATP synthase complex subunit 8 n=1 Tax=Hospesneotomae protracta TaxID=72493 RepID=A0A7U3N0L5_HOSPR|nr:ATP synthase F0 subunit 8 [Triatoma protracta]